MHKLPLGKVYLVTVRHGNSSGCESWVITRYIFFLTKGLQTSLDECRANTEPLSRVIDIEAKHENSRCSI